VTYKFYSKRGIRPRTPVPERWRIFLTALKFNHSHGNLSVKWTFKY